MAEPRCGPQQPLSLAIVGGGIAGLTLCIALIKYCSSMTITVYESASSFGEIGAGVGFQPVMVRTMSLIDPRITAAFEKCNKGNTVTEPPVWFTVRVGDRRKYDSKTGHQCRADMVEERRETGLVEDAGLGDEAFLIPARRGPGGGVHRAHFLDELIKLIPDGVTQFHKRLVNATEATDGSDGAILHFSDGSSARHSAVIGCDGIKSRIRSLVLGDSESAIPEFSGKYAYRGLVQMAKAREILGDEQSRTPQMFLGYHGHVLTFPIANGTILNVVAFSSRSHWPHSNWVVQTSREEMLEDYKHWSTPIRTLMANLQSPDVWALFDHLPATTYYSKKPLICLVGDAAHASTPHQGAGAGMCIEDVYILSQLLSQCSSKSDLEKAFDAYDVVRRPRSQQLVRTSKEAGALWDFEAPGVSDDVKELERNALHRMKWIWDFDISTDMEKARMMMQDTVGNGVGA